MPFCLLKLKQNGALKVCCSSKIEPTENTDTCEELGNSSWHFGDSTFARSTDGNRCAVIPLLFTGELLTTDLMIFSSL